LWFVREVFAHNSQDIDRPGSARISRSTRPFRTIEPTFSTTSIRQLLPPETPTK